MFVYLLMLLIGCYSKSSLACAFKNYSILPISYFCLYPKLAAFGFHEIHIIYRKQNKMLIDKSFAVNPWILLPKNIFGIIG